MATTVDLIREELQKLEVDGNVTAARVVEAASDVTHPLHDFFEWDDSEAARRFRMIQARSLIQRVRVEYRTVPGQTVTAPVYIRDPRVPTTDQGYTRVSILTKTKSDAIAGMAIELARAMSILGRAREIAAAMGLAEQVDAILRSLSDLQRAL